MPSEFVKKENVTFNISNILTTNDSLQSQMKALVKLELNLCSYWLPGNYFYTKIWAINNETSGHKGFHI